MTENLTAVNSNIRKAVNKGNQEKGKQENENQPEKLKFRGLAHNLILLAYVTQPITVCSTGRAFTQ